MSSSCDPALGVVGASGAGGDAVGMLLLRQGMQPHLATCPSIPHVIRGPMSLAQHYHQEDGLIHSQQTGGLTWRSTCSLSLAATARRRMTSLSTCPCSDFNIYTYSIFYILSPSQASNPQSHIPSTCFVHCQGPTWGLPASQEYLT